MNIMDIRRAINRVGEETVRMLRENIGRLELGQVVFTNPTGDTTRKIDLIAEEYLVDQVKSSGLKAWVLSEERGLYKLTDNPELLIVADPLDGSLNYILEIPFSAVSIAVYGLGNLRLESLVYGFVANIFREEKYEFYEGRVYLNNTELRQTSRGEGVICIHTINPLLVDKIRRFVLSKGGRPKLRTLGAASLEAVYTAIGKMEYYINDVGGIRLNDIAVGLAIALNRGLRVTLRPYPVVVSPDHVTVFSEVWITPGEFH
ncbi:inositol monophosphatase family protein [Thermogladius sp. 4427co]|uniref:inositol monophosphatase family protein n=1 Tax=Thermogladius sp. 4427co TaxID=3450718 RepID=UPI003F7B24CE